MTDTRISVSFTVAFLALVLAAVLAIQPYSVRPQWSVYDAPGQKFLSAALERDSSALTRLSVSSSAVAWAIRTKRDHPRALSVWAQLGRAGTGVIQSDTSRVLFDTPTEVCPLLVTFVGHDTQLRVLEAKARCYSNPQDVK